MLDWLTKVIEKEVVKVVEKEKIVVVGDSVVDVYIAYIPKPVPPSDLESYYDPDAYNEKKKQYMLALAIYDASNPKYFTDPVEAFRHSKGNPVSTAKAIKCSDGNCYLLEARAVITIEGDAIER